MAPNPTDRIRIAATATVSERTVARAYSGANLASTTRARIERAAQELGLPLPPAPAMTPSERAA